MILGQLLILIGTVLYYRTSRRWEALALGITSFILILKGGFNLTQAYLIHYVSIEKWRILVIGGGILEFILQLCLGLFILLLLVRCSKLYREM